MVIVSVFVGIQMYYLKLSPYFFNLLLFSFFIFLRCHFQRICPFFFHLLEDLFTVIHPYLFSKNSFFQDI